MPARPELYEQRTQLEVEQAAAKMTGDTETVAVLRARIFKLSQQIQEEEFANAGPMHYLNVKEAAALANREAHIAALEQQIRDMGGEPAPAPEDTP